MISTKAFNLSDRFQLALNELKILPGDVVLEIGPGSGLALELIATKLKTGKVVAVDQSAAMLEKAKSRLRKERLIEKVVLIHGDASEVDLTQYSFSKIFAFNVNIFLKAAPLPFLNQAVTAKTVVGVFYQNPPGSPWLKMERMLDNVEQLLEKQGFGECRHITISSLANPAAGIIAKRPARSRKNES